MSRIVPAFGRALRETGQALDRLGLALSGEHSVKEVLSRHRAVSNLGGLAPRVGPGAFVAPSASVVGDVALGQHSSVWYGAVVRGDVNSVKIGAYTNIQDAAVIHVAKHNVGGKARPTVVGDHVTVGHGAVLHACTLEDASFVGMGATVMDGATVQRGAMVAAGALVTPGTVVPSGQIWAGQPARFLRAMTGDESAFIRKSAENYAVLAQQHAAENSKSDAALAHDAAMREVEVDDSAFLAAR